MMHVKGSNGRLLQESYSAHKCTVWAERRGFSAKCGGKGKGRVHLRPCHEVPAGESIYRVEQEECATLREGVPYVKLYRKNPKHLYPKLNGLGDNGQ